MKRLSDNDIVDHILKGGKWRETAIKNLLLDEKYYHRVSAYIRNNRGNDHDVEDIWQEGITQIDNDIRSGKFKRLGSVRNYLVQTCKYLWNNTRKKASRNNELLSGDSLPEKPNEDNPEKTTEQNDHSRHFRKTLEKGIGANCTQILILSKSGYSMQEIAEIMELEDADHAKTKKHRCRKKLLKKLEENPDWLNWLK